MKIGIIIRIHLKMLQKQQFMYARQKYMTVSLLALKYMLDSYTVTASRRTQSQEPYAIYFLSIDPLYPPGLDENRAVDYLYAASWICSETALLQQTDQVQCTYKFFSTAAANSSALNVQKQEKRIKFRQIRPRQEHTKGPLTGKNNCLLDI